MQYLYITLSLYVYWLAVCGILLFGEQSHCRVLL